MAFDKTLKIASFNCFNLVRPGVIYYDNAAYSEQEFNAKLTWCAALLEQTQADLVGFQEVFSIQALKDLVARVPHLSGAEVIAPGAEPDLNEKPDEDNPTETRAIMPKVGLATNLPVLEAREISDFPADALFSFPRVSPETGEEDFIAIPLHRFQRPVLKSRVQLANGVPATVFVAHLKSKRPSYLPGEEDDPTPLQNALGSVRSLLIRSMEAAALRALVLDVVDDPVDGARGEPVIVLGDLNDSESAVSTRAISGERPWMFAPPDEKKRIWDTLLYNAHELQAEQSLSGAPFSHIHDGHYEILDHILLSQEFYRRFSGNIGEFRSARVFNDHLIDGGQTDDRHGRIVSDHGVPVAEIKLKPADALNGGANV